jgi:hypothetical protein
LLTFVDEGDYWAMRTTKYFDHIRSRSDRAIIQDRWILDVVAHPLQTVVQTDGRIKKWGFIGEADKYLRVIMLEDGETVHNAFFDRTYKGRTP